MYIWTAEEGLGFKKGGDMANRKRESSKSYDIHDLLINIRSNE